MHVDEFIIWLHWMSSPISSLYFCNKVFPQTQCSEYWLDWLLSKNLGSTTACRLCLAPWYQACSHVWPYMGIQTHIFMLAHLSHYNPLRHIFSPQPMSCVPFQMLRHPSAVMTNRSVSTGVEGCNTKVTGPFRRNSPFSIPCFKMECSDWMLLHRS